MSAPGAQRAASDGPSALDVSVSRFDGSAAEWDAFVKAQAGWTHFHLFGWRTVIERVFHHECIHLAARDPGGRLRAVLPLVRVRSLIFGHYLVSMPFVNYGGPIGDEVGIRALTDEASVIAKRDSVKLLELRSRTQLPIEMPVSHRKITVVLDLPETPEALWKALPAKLRSQVRRPQKEGVTMRFGTEQVGAFYAVFAEHMRDLGTPVLPRSLFDALADVFPDDVFFAVAYHNDQPVACGCGFMWGSEFEITWASALRSHKSMSPNMLVYWELMERVTKAGARLFNFGRCSPDSGTHKFKKQWGGRDEMLWWYQQTRDPGAETAGTPSPDQGIFAIATRVWQRLPLPIANAVGPSIVRFIP